MTDYQSEEYTVSEFFAHAVKNLNKGQELLAELDPKALETAEACNRVVSENSIALPRNRLPKV